MSNPLMPGDPMTEAHKQQLLKAILQKLSPQGETPVVEYRVSLDQSIEAAIQRLINTQASVEGMLNSISDKAQVMGVSLGKLDAASKQMLSVHDDRVKATERSLQTANTAADQILSKSSVKAEALASMVTALQNDCLRLTETIAATTKIVAEAGRTDSAGTQEQGRALFGFLKNPISTKRALGALLAIVVCVALIALWMKKPDQPDVKPTQTAAQADTAAESEQPDEFVAESLQDCARPDTVRHSSCDALADGFDHAFKYETHCKDTPKESAVFCRLVKSLPDARKLAEGLSEADKDAIKQGYRYSAVCDVVAQSVSENCRRGIYSVEKRMREAAAAGDEGSDPG
jgi:hypothetical protein